MTLTLDNRLPLDEMAASLVESRKCDENPKPGGRSRLANKNALVMQFTTGPRYVGLEQFATTAQAP